MQEVRIMFFNTSYKELVNVLSYFVIAIWLCLQPISAQWVKNSYQTQREIASIDIIWLIVAEAITKQNVGDVQNAILQWRDVGTFDAFSIGLLPPTFTDLDSSIALANKLHQLIPRRLIVGAFPSGTEGWETSFNQQFAQQLAPLEFI
jgi:hypothetical protein